ncbi:tetratricopeptide repeat protein 12-like [Neocloeon triangulifer]|uniref:tetratricopeptide repeat protein 12-like n=1 Tax=Neocloeon triangulifer TaxID=2078957 RepID=UPI00286EEC37|nr:tetratricopeptide repeat protein 12-like [Neocloeon triangulifer]XP_059470831.1 tetratricopeptide repeat protein 12-like [Neocloeon triangulifer]XP_059470832.1 tetratricopeptide repeat protein 12-like [Neocloeon triangulifer]
MSDEDFDDFMLKVDKVGDLVKKLKEASASDSKAMQEADKYLKKLESERTKINVKPNNNAKNNDGQNSNAEQLDNRKDSGNLHTLSPEEFMRKVNEDAEKREAERRDRKAVSDTYKKEANVAFRSGDYLKALLLYNKAIDEVRDSCVLYTNRALTNLHLECYTKVLEDCKSALRVNPASLKALVYKARAHKALGQIELAQACTQEAVNLHPNHKAFIRHAVLKDSIADQKKSK